MIVIKNYVQFLTEKEEVHEKEPGTKELVLGRTKSGRKITGKFKLGHTIALSPEDFSHLWLMKVTHKEEDMYDFARGGRDYRISKDEDGKCTVFHYNKTLHELLPVGVFKFKKKKSD